MRRYIFSFISNILNISISFIKLHKDNAKINNIL